MKILILAVVSMFSAPSFAHPDRITVIVEGSIKENDEWVKKIYSSTSCEHSESKEHALLKCTESGAVDCKPVRTKYLYCRTKCSCL